MDSGDSTPCGWIGACDVPGYAKVYGMWHEKRWLVYRTRGAHVPALHRDHPQAREAEEAQVSWLIALAVFVASAAYDAVFAIYVRAVADVKALPAANRSVCTFFVGLPSLLAFTQLSVWYVLPTACGYWVGTFAAVKFLEQRD